MVGLRGSRGSHDERHSDGEGRRRKPADAGACGGAHVKSVLSGRFGESAAADPISLGNGSPGGRGPDRDVFFCRGWIALS
ncbi:hypothetical protein Ait01nite_091710 [Actinoplanes italicus]|nr:hypothetical protein Ait01nite_091710 [Actinoplanes italicus]